MKTSKVTHLQNATPPTWANPKDGTVFNRYLVTMTNGEQYTFLARGEFKRKVGEEISYEVKSEQHKTAKLLQDPKPQFKPQVFGRKDDNVQEMIVRQSMYAAAMQFYQNRNAEEDEAIALGDRLIQRVLNG